RASDGPLGSYAIFVPLYVLGVVAWTAAAPVQRGVWLAAGAAGGAIGLAEALVWGDGNPSATAFLAVLGVLAILRMGTLASRDWKEPVKGALLWGSVAALVEIAVAGSAVPAWRTLLPVVVGQFFVGSLASRAATTAAWAERLVGLAVIAVLTWALAKLGRHRLVRGARRRPLPEVFEPSTAEASRLPEPQPRRRSRIRRDLPGDLVRRWYAEALLLLERRGVIRPPALTPGEYSHAVAKAFPECRGQFEALTRAYEDVRYGNRSVDPPILRTIDA